MFTPRFTVHIVLVLALATVAGCSDTPELRIQQARIAIAHAKPDRALAIIQQVLDEQPTERQALQLKARAQILLSRFEDCEQTFAVLLVAHPDSADARLQVIEWAWLFASDLIKQPGFKTDDQLQDRFDRILAAGNAQVRRLADHPDHAANVRYYQARYAVLDAQRLTLLAFGTNADPSYIGPDQVAPTVASDTAAERWQSAKQYLHDALVADPRHYQAREMYADLLARDGEWGKLWDLAQQAQQIGFLPASTAEKLVLALIVMPDHLHPRDDRLALGRQVQSAVITTQRNSPAWKTTNARLHQASGQWDKARQLLAPVVRTDPANLDAQYMLAKSHYAMREYDHAKTVLEKLLPIAPFSARVYTLYGLVLTRTGSDPSPAVDALSQAIRLDPSDTVARKALLTLHAQHGDADLMRADLDGYLQHHPTDTQAIRLKVQLDASQGRPETAAELLDRLAMRHPHTDDQLQTLADGYLMIDQPRSAMVYAQRLVDRYPRSLEHHLRLAQVLLIQGERDRVEQMASDLHEQFSDAPEAAHLLGKLYMRLNAHDQAAALFEQAVQRDPDNIPVRLDYAKALASMLRIDDALQQIDHVLDQDAHDMRAHILAAHIYQFTGQQELANQHLTHIDESTLDESVSPSLLAQIKLKKGDAQAALAICNRAIAGGHPDPILRILAAAIAAQQDDPDRARDHLIDLVHAYPNNRLAYALLTRFYIDQGSVEAGLDQLTKFETLNKPLARLAQASLLHGVGRFRDALDRLDPIYQELIRTRSPAALTVADAMAMIHIDNRNRVAAQEVYDPLVAAGLRTTTAKLRQIDLSASTSQAHKLAQQLEELAVNIRRDQTRLRHQVIQRLAKFGHNDRALRLINRWIDQQQSQPLWHRWRGDLLIELGRTDDAIRAYQTAVDLAPQNTAARLQLAEAHADNFDYPAAQAVLSDAAKRPGHARIAALTVLGRMFTRIGLNQHAADVFEQARQAGPARDPYVALTVGQSLSAIGQDDQARKHLAQVPRFAPQYPRAQILLARIEQRSGAIIQAKKRLADLARDRATAAVAVQELLALDLRQSHTQQLVRWTDAALSVQQLGTQTKRQWLELRLRLAAQESNWHATLAAIEQISELDPDSLAAKTARILLVYHLGMSQHAQGLYRLWPQLAESERGSALAIVIGQDVSPVVTGPPLFRFLAGLTQQDPTHARAVAQEFVGTPTIYRGDLIAALDHPDIASPQTAQACRDLLHAALAIQAGLPELAHVYTRQAITLVPWFVPAHALHAQALLEINEPLDPVLAIVDQVAPTSALTIYLKAHQQSQLGNHAVAAQYLQALVEREPDNVHARYDLSRRLEQSGRIDDAIALLEKIVQDDGPYRAPAANNLAYLLARQHPHRLDDAYELAQQALQAAPASSPVLDTVGWIEYLRCNHDKALQYLSRAIVGLAAVPEAHQHLGAVYQSLGNDTWAQYHLKQARSYTGDTAQARLADTPPREHQRRTDHEILDTPLVTTDTTH